MKKVAVDLNGGLVAIVGARSSGKTALAEQPEENLDPNSVFEELVPRFAKRERADRS